MQFISTATAVPALAFAGSACAMATTADRTGWDAAMARFRAAEREHKTIGEHFDRVEKAFFEAREKVPHVAVGPDLYSGLVDPVTTANESMVRHARRRVAEIANGTIKFDAGVPGIGDHIELCHRLAAAADARDAEIKAINERLGYDRASEACDAACDRMCDARDVLIAMPAPDGEALLWKLQWLFFEDSIWQQEHVAQTVADAHRFLAVGNA